MTRTHEGLLISKMTTKYNKKELIKLNKPKLKEICQELKIEIINNKGKEISKNDMIDLIIKLQQEKRDESADQYHRGIVEYSLPWLLITRIIDYLIKWNKRCVCPPDKDKSIVIHERCLQHGSTTLMGSRWRNSLGMICKQMFKHVSQTQSFKFLDELDDDECRQFGKHVSNVWCITKRVTQMNLFSKSSMYMIDGASKPLFQNVERLGIAFGERWNSRTVPSLEQCFQNLTHLTIERRVASVNVSIACSIKSLIYLDLDLDFGKEQDTEVVQECVNAIRAPLKHFYINAYIEKHNPVYLKSLIGTHVYLHQSEDDYIGGPPMIEEKDKPLFLLAMDRLAEYNLTSIRVEPYRYRWGNFKTTKIFPFITHITFKHMFLSDLFLACVSLESLEIISNYFDPFLEFVNVIDKSPASFRKFKVTGFNNYKFYVIKPVHFQKLNQYSFQHRYTYKGYTKYIKK